MMNLLPIPCFGPSIWIQWLIDMGRRTFAKEILRGTCGRLLHGCRILISNLINKGTFWFSESKKLASSNATTSI